MFFTNYVLKCLIFILCDRGVHSAEAEGAYAPLLFRKEKGNTRIVYYDIGYFTICFIKVLILVYPWH